MGVLCTHAYKEIRNYLPPYWVLSWLLKNLWLIEQRDHVAKVVWYR